jgi:hypothetical protein
VPAHAAAAELLDSKAANRSDRSVPENTEDTKLDVFKLVT